MTENPNWNAIVDSACDVFIIWPICQNNFVFSIKHCESDIYLVIVECEFVVFLDYV